MKGRLIEAFKVILENGYFEFHFGDDLPEAVFDVWDTAICVSRSSQNAQSQMVTDFHLKEFYIRSIKVICVAAALNL